MQFIIKKLCLVTISRFPFGHARGRRPAFAIYTLQPPVRSCTGGCNVYCFFSLFKITDAGAENVMISSSRNIYRHAFTDALVVRHFTEYAAVRTQNALHCADRSIGIIGHLHRRPAGLIHILGCDLPVLYQLFDYGVARNKTAFAHAKWARCKFRPQRCPQARETGRC